MVWLIELIDRNKKLYGAVLTAVYIAVIVYSCIDYKLIVQGSIFFLLPIILFSFLGMKIGLLVAGLSQHPFVWHFGGALVSFAVAYAFGTIKSLYSKEKRSEKIIKRSKAQYQKV
jgi:uncharacterized membrane protein YjjP (DUF1212 family)